uniref:PX domain-containing protein n=1 Tax=Timema cristinae TaxID=61476 RepID=A0A7R9CIR6_TIMCR|nr:unnamed protein product [Timema cristinae]
MGPGCLGGIHRAQRLRLSSVGVVNPHNYLACNLTPLSSYPDRAGPQGGYSIHVNGVFHCTVRYRQLLNLHEQLKKEYGSSNLPSFPPKKILPLSPTQLEERRAMLEKYIQTIGQDSQLVNADILNGFLLSAQQETSCEKSRQVPLDVYLMNGYKVSLNVLTTERSVQVLEKVCQQINLPGLYVYYFSLFLIKREEDGSITVSRKLQDFESPFISQKAIKGVNRVTLRKSFNFTSYWDPGYDLELMSDSVALNLLYVQTVADVEHGWVLTNKETQQRLALLQARGAKQEVKITAHTLGFLNIPNIICTFMKSCYLELARELKYYGFLQFRSCFCDYPQPGSMVVVSVGNRELNLRVRFGDNQEMKEGSFKVTRMRCWRITTLHNKVDKLNDSPITTSHQLSFEYLMSKDKLQWITIASEQAILMSICLQSMVDELLLKKTGIKRKQNGGVNESSKTESSSSIKKLSEKLSSVSLKSSSSKQLVLSHPFVENDAFEGIGDDDL